MSPGRLSELSPLTEANCDSNFKAGKKKMLSKDYYRTEHNMWLEHTCRILPVLKLELTSSSHTLLLPLCLLSSHVCSSLTCLEKNTLRRIPAPDERNGTFQMLYYNVNESYDPMCF